MYLLLTLLLFFEVIAASESLGVPNQFVQRVCLAFHTHDVFVLRREGVSLSKNKGLERIAARQEASH